MNKGWLSEKVIVIIGGTTGLGLDAARRCIEEGAKIVVVGRDPEHTKQAGHLLGQHGLAISGDATEVGTAEMAIHASVERFGSFTGLYHVAGGSGRRFGDGPLHDITEEGWMKTLHWNLDSVMYSNRAAVKYFLEQNSSGVILNMSSVLGFSPSPKYFATHAYAAAKSAVIGFSRSLASYYASNDIRVNVIAPGLVETPMSQRAFGDEQIMKFISSKQPLGRGALAQPADLSGTVVYLLSDHSKLVTGQTIAVDGGWSVTEGQYE
jgi:NAD(P)-dependent dehydrogenase (short-subunit alcohol dehydrogenase family)